MALGNAALLADEHVTVGDIQARLDTQRREGRMVLLVALDGQFAGFLNVADPIRTSTFHHALK